ncbi:GNAT family N-acetyltransferase [Nocardioides sp. LHG3406-4]|uniref:GNAT family N-acetyltransferase n=1 Tax=Nocardioides sp. LHG3406-4 TaxID=2804575 RepID=UPI003CEFD76D
MTDLTIRRGAREDLPAVAELYLTVRKAAEPLMPPLAHVDDDVRAWVLGWSLHLREVWLAFAGDRLVGFANLSPHWLNSLYVDPSAQRDGVGSALLDVVKSRLEGGFALWVFETNTPARDFYLRHGLVELERTDGWGNEERAPDIKMAWAGPDPVGFYRWMIDEVDDQLADLLARRVALTRAVQPHKASAARDPDREREIAVRMAESAPELGTERIARILDVVITESLDAAGS